ncbi:fluoride efflux transporter CrcB [Rhodobacteraceae bacterium nBUS_22]
MSYLFVSMGGAIGALLRFVVGQQVAFPFGTLSVNILGSFLMGLGFVYLTSRVDDRLALLLMTGVLGGFTTFSAFSLDVYRLHEAGRNIFAVGYVGVSVLGSLAAVIFGVLIMRVIMS